LDPFLGKPRVEDVPEVAGRDVAWGRLEQADEQPEHLDAGMPVQAPVEDRVAVLRPERKVARLDHHARDVRGELAADVVKRDARVAGQLRPQPVQPARRQIAHLDLRALAHSITRMARSTTGNAAADRLARLPSAIEARGVRHNNLRDLDVDIPLWCVVAVAGVSGSGKSSLATGTLFAEGMQRFLEGLSTYSRRRLSQAQRPDVDRIDHLPAALALRQRPPIPGVRSTVGTMSEVLNVLRLIMSRLGTHICPNGHPVAPTVSTQGMEMTCPVCGLRFTHPGAESFAFNSYGACPACNGTGELFQVDVDALVPDEDKTINEGAVLPWNAGGRRLYRYAAGQLGVRLDVPFRELTARERDIVFHGEPVERDVTLREGTPRAITLNVHYENAV